MFMIHQATSLHQDQNKLTLTFMSLSKAKEHLRQQLQLSQLAQDHQIWNLPNRVQYKNGNEFRMLPIKNFYVV